LDPTAKNGFLLSREWQKKEMIEKQGKRMTTFIFYVIPCALAPYLVSPALVAGLRGTRNLPLGFYDEIAARGPQ
jgi:hypothetical protein